MNKYRNKITTVDNIKFHSAKESRRYLELKLLERAGEIKSLRLQPVFPLVVGEKLVCKFIADFDYYTSSGEYTVEDVKSEATKRLPAYRIKKKLFEALYGFEILET